jgi:hypothetical protein
MSRGTSENCGTAYVPLAATARYRSFPPANVEGEKNALIKNQGDESLRIGPRCHGSDDQPASKLARNTGQFRKTPQKISFLFRNKSSVS